jgi:hypothetical protein
MTKAVFDPLASKAKQKPDFELIARAMQAERGDLVKVSRLPQILYNTMQLRDLVRKWPQIRQKYFGFVAEELQELELHITERISKMAREQQKAFDADEPRLAIELSKEISRLIAEGKGANMSSNTALVLTSKEDAVELLKQYLGG